MRVSPAMSDAGGTMRAHITGTSSDGRQSIASGGVLVQVSAKDE